MIWMPPNIGPDGLPLMYSFLHERECQCVSCRLLPDVIEATARLDDERREESEC